VAGSRYTILTCWTAPFFCRHLGEAPRELAMLLWRSGDTLCHLLPLCDGDHRADLHGDGDGLLVELSSFCTGSTGFAAAAFVLGRGSDPFELAARTAGAAFEALGQRRRLRADKGLPEPFDHLGWCSWDAFHRDVTDAGIRAKAEELRRRDVPVRWFLIDDGWSPTRDEMLLDFGVDAAKFPRGLAPLITELKRDFGLRWVGVWQNFMGYWQGAHPDGALVRQRAHLLHRTAHGRWMPPPDAAGSYSFWDAWNRDLAAAGVDFVKSDSQSTAAVFVQDDVPLGRAVRALHQGLEASARARFAGGVINCTAMGHETTWSHPEGVISRNSADYNPAEPASMRGFIVANVYNSFWYSQLFHTDWDMWWTRSPTTKLSAVLHAVGGGILYISDKVGATEPAAVLPFVLPDGRLLRCDGAGMPTADLLFVDPETEPLPLKAWNTVGGAGVVAAFNVHREGIAVRGELRADDVPGLTGRPCWAYDWYARRVTHLAAGAALPVRLDADDAALFVLVPAAGALTPIGVVDKYVPPATISTRVDLPGRCVLVLRTGGTFAYVATGEHRVRVDGQPVTPVADNGFFRVDCGGDGDAILVELESR
jgi:raffinose synthase